MQKLFEIGFAQKNHHSDLKELWHSCFGDSFESINHFFNSVVNNQNVVCALYQGEPVSALYVVDSFIHVDGEQQKALYIYAVCTKEEYRGNKLSEQMLSFLEGSCAANGVSYLYLVPAQKSLFEFYKKLGFSVAFRYKEKAVEKKAFSSSCSIDKPLTYQTYNATRKNNVDEAYTVLSEEGFDAFYSYVGQELQSFSLGSEGYAVFEKENNKVTVHECLGNKAELLSYVFKKTQADVIYVREPSKTNGEPYGMVKALDGSSLFDNGFLGVSYGG